MVGGVSQIEKPGSELKMVDTRELLLRLIEESANDHGCSEEQTKKIRALVVKSIDDHLPEVSELRALLKAIGRG